jgi:PAS domain S-box-containing protein
MTDRLFRALVENGWEALALIDACGTIRYASPSIARILGYRPEELVGHSGLELMHPDDQPAATELFAHLLQQPGTTITAQYRHQHRDGSWRWIEATGTNLLSDPDVGAIICNFRDITERKEAEEGVRIITAGARCILWRAEVSESGQECLDWDLHVPDEEAAQRFFPVDIPPGLSYVPAWYESRLPEDKARMGVYGSQEVRAGRDYRQEFRCRRKDGEIRWLAEDVQVEIVGPGHWRVVGVCMDVTERKQAQAALESGEEEERHFAQQLTALQEVSNELSKAASFDDLCRAAVELGCGRLDFERLGLWLTEGDPASATGTFGVDESGQIRDERGSRITIRPQSVAGQVLASRQPCVIRHDAPIRDLHAEIVGHGTHAIAGLWNGEAVIGFLSTDNLLHRRPVTDRQCRLLTLYASALGHLLALKRLEEELRRRAWALEEADRRKDEFLAMLAHELRNPLAPILNATQLMRLCEVSDPVLRRARDVVERQSRLLARLVEDLLDVSRITQGKIGLRPETVELAAVVNGAVETTRPLIETRELELCVSLPPEPIRLVADPARLEQVLANLLHNAAKYTDPGGRVWLAVESSEAEVRIEVRDTGIGISPELLPHLFDLFTQADRSLDRSQGGLGIGLTLVKRLVEMHDGRVQAYSAGPGQGSRFVVCLPAADEN